MSKYEEDNYDSSRYFDERNRPNREQIEELLGAKTKEGKITRYVGQDVFEIRHNNNKSGIVSSWQSIKKIVRIK